MIDEEGLGKRKREKEREKREERRGGYCLP